MRVVIAGGGTGGHLFPGLAVAEELLARDKGSEVLFLGAQGGLEERIVPLHNYRLEILPSLKGGLLGLHLAQKTLHACQGYLQARRLILEFGAQATVGLGGYVSALPVMASWGVEVPVLMLEQNVIP
jgi:UDP-N-acetylglucosamine--N-acetylmuramyl-(pentapeptide) pyrophosphoryl-undecaprenol N-acetylglucosamine transferase